MLSDLLLLIVNFVVKVITAFLPRLTFISDFTIPLWVQNNLGFVSGFFPLALLFQLLSYVLFIEIAFISYRLIIFVIKFTPFVKTDHISKS